MFTMFQSHMNVYALTGQKCDLHELGHNGDPASKGTLAVSKMIAWHMKHFAYLIAKLRDTTEGAGSLLDNVALVFLHEGGHGLDTATGEKNSTHSTENMACLIAGRAGGLKGGQHVAATGKHPANVLDHGDERGRRRREAWARSPATSRPCSADARAVPAAILDRLADPGGRTGRMRAVPPYPAPRRPILGALLVLAAASGLTACEGKVGAHARARAAAAPTGAAGSTGTSGRR